MTDREEMSEVHGNEFVENFDDVFEIVEKPTVRPIVLDFLLKYKVPLFYAAGFADALIVVYIVKHYL